MRGWLRSFLRYGGVVYVDGIFLVGEGFVSDGEWWFGLVGSRLRLVGLRHFCG